MKNTSKVLISIALLLLLIFPVTAGGDQEAGGAESWPTGPVTAYVNAKAGGNMDVKMRIMAKYLEPLLGTSFAINNLPGGGGAVELTQFLTEKPNSNAIAFNGDGALAIAPLFDTLQYSADDFIIVSGTDTVQVGLFINSALGVESIDDLKEYAQGKVIKFSAAGVNSATYIMTKYALNLMGIKSDIITDKGYPTALVNVASGTADICLVALNMAASYIEDGSIRPLAVYQEDAFGGYASLGFPSVPSLKSFGYEITWDNLAFIAMRAGTDPVVVNKMSDALRTVFNNPDFQSEFLEAGYVQLEDPSPEATQLMITQKIAAAQMYYAAVQQQ